MEFSRRGAAPRAVAARAARRARPEEARESEEAPAAAPRPVPSAKSPPPRPPPRRPRGPGGAEGVRQRLPATANPAEATAIAAAAPSGLGRHELDDGGDDLRPGGEVARRDVEEAARPRGTRRRPRGSRSRRPRAAADPLGDLALDHHDEPREEVGAPRERPDHRRRRLVGEVRDEGDGRRDPGFGEGRRRVDVEGVRLDDAERVAAELLPEARGEARVDLDREDPEAAREEGPRQGAAPGADLDDPAPGRRAERVDDPGRRPRAREEVLTEARPP